jgi:DNA-binding CsgD family transcriptional regulator
MEALIWSGRFGDAQERLDVLRGLDLEHIWGGASTCELALARGDVEAAAPLVGAAALFAAESDTLPDDRWVLRRVRVAALLDDAPEALEAATTYLRQLETCDSPLIAGAAARVGYHALTLVAMKHGPASDELADLAARQRDRARAALTDEWRGGYYGVQLALAEGYAARFEGRSAVAEFRAAVGLAEPFGSFFALEPRLDLAQELLAQGDRDEGRELLVECWTAAHEMGAGGLERRAAKMATRHRVPLPESAAREGPLSRLTPREREILDRLALGATNQTIAEELFISPKTVSVHVSNLLAKLGVENRGAAAALARDLVG